MSKPRDETKIHKKATQSRSKHKMLFDEFKKDYLEWKELQEQKLRSKKK